MSFLRKIWESLECETKWWHLIVYLTAPLFLFIILFYILEFFDITIRDSVIFIGIIIVFCIGYIFGQTSAEHRQTRDWIKRGYEYDPRFNEWVKKK